MKVRNKNRKLHKIKKWMNIMLASVMTASMAVQGLPSEAVSAFAQSTDSQSGSLKTEEQNTDSQTDVQEKADADSKSSQTDVKSDRNNSESDKKSKSTTSQLKSKNDKKNTDGEDKKSLETEKKDASSSDKSADNSSLKDIKGKTHESETMKYISDEKNENLVSRAETTAEKKLDEDSAPSKKILDTDSMSKTLIPTAHRMTLNYLYADKKYVSSDTTIDSLWKKSQKMDKESPIIGSFLSYAQLYVMKDNPNVYVTFADSGRFNGLSHAVYADFTDGNTSDPKNYNSQVRLDKKTGIIYIPRSLFTDGNGKETAKTLYGQLLVPFTLPKNRNVKNDVDVEISNRRNDIRTKFSRKTLSLSSFNTVTSIPVAEKKTASELSSDKITVYVNDETIPHKFSSGEYEYSQKTGVLKLKIMPSSLYKIRIVLEDDKVSEKIAKTFAEKTYADAASEKIAEYLKTDGGESSLTFSSENVSNGALYEIPNRNVYYNKADGTWTGTIDDTCDTYRNKYAKYCYYFNSDSEGARLNHIIGDTDKGLSTWRDNASNLLVSSNIMSLYSFLFASPKVGGSKYAALNGASDEAAMKLSGSWPKYLPLHCAHTLAGYNETRYTDSEKSNVKMRILSSQWNDEGRKAKTGDWVVIGFAIDEDTGDQQSQGVYKVKITVDTTEDEDGTVTVEKIWNDNDASDSSRPTPVIYVQKSGSSGDSDKYSSSDSKVCKLTKSGSTWTYEFTLPKGQYRAWEGSLGDSHYISSNPESDKIETETGDICTITNTNLKIRVKKKWNDSLTNDQRKTPNIHISAPESAVYIRSDVIRERKQIDGAGFSSNSNSGRYMNYSLEGVNGSDYWASSDVEGYCGIINALFGHDIEKIIYADNITDEKDIPEGAKRIDKNYYNKNARYKVYAWKEGNDVYYWTNANIIKLTNSTRHLFAYFGYITRIDLQKIDTSEMTNMSHMFAGDGYLLTPAEVMNGGYDLKNSQKGTWTTPILDLDLSSFDTSNVTAMDSMFAGMAVNYINLKTFNTSKVQNIFNLFGSSYIRSSLDMRNFDLSGADYNEHYDTALDANYWESKFYYPAGNWKNSDAIIQSETGAIGDDSYKTLSEIGIAGNFKNPKTPTLKKQQLKYSYKNGDCTISKNGDTWTYTFYVANDDLIYDAWEDELDGYVTNHSKNSKGQTSKDDVLTITNTEIKKRDIKVIKEWNDTDIEHPDVSVQLYRNDESLGSSYKVTLNESNKWTHTWKDLDATDENGNNYRYTVKEDKLSDYINDISVKDLEDGTRVYTITNTKNEEHTNLHVQKIWDDSDNADGLRPARIKVQLYSVSTAGEKAYGDAAILSDGNSWEYFWTNLPTIDDDKNDVTYTAKETAYSYTMDGDFTDITDESGIPEYYSYTSKSDGNIVLINQHSRRMTDFSAEKEWDDDSNRDGIRPSSITVSLYADGVKVDGQDKTLSSSNSFSCSWYELPERKNGKDIIYTAVEENVPSGYTAKYEMSGNSSTITNVHTPEKTEADVSKVWNDENDKLSFRPKAIKVSLKRNGSSYDTQILNAENGWHYKWSDLYKYYSGGNRYSYTVSETAYSLDGSSFISGTPYSYRLSVSDDEDSSDAFRYTLTNTLQKTVNAEKRWDDNDQSYSRPSSITYILYANESEIDRETVTARDGWSYSWTGLQAFDSDGKEISYRAEEAPLDEYNTSSEITKSDTNAVQNFTFINTPVNLVSVSADKVWKDGNNKLSQRPKAVYMQLYANGEAVSNPQALNEENGWSCKWSDLVKSRDGKVIAYSVQEIGYSSDGNSLSLGIPENYECSVSDDKDSSENFSYTATNTAVTEVDAEKTWNDSNQTYSRPAKITYILYANGQEADRKEVTAADKWKCSWTGLHAFDDSGSEITYSVEEAPLEEYITEKTESSENSVHLFRFTNTPKNPVSVSVSKIWKDADNKPAQRPKAVKVQLYADNTQLYEPVILNDDNSWSYKWTNLARSKDSSDIAYSVKEIAYSADGSTFKSGIPANYKCTYSETKSESGDISFEVTNTAVIKVQALKKWNDNSQAWSRPDSITMQLYRNGVLYNSYKLYDTDNENARSVHWMHTWNNLPAYDDNGNSYVYTVSEDVSADSGYTSSVEDKSTDSDIFTKSFEITNTPEMTTASVKKVWDDADNKNNVRPSQIKVQLYRENDKIGDPVILSADNGWSYTWENLIRKKDSKSVRYTAREIAYSNDGSTWNDGVPPMYTEKYTNESDTEITITNTEDTTVTVEKDWKDGLKNADRKEEPVIHLVSDNVSNQSTVHLREITKAGSSFASPLFYAFDAGDGSLYTDKIEYASEITDEKDVPKYASRIDRNYSVRDAKYKVYAWTEKESGSSGKVIKYWTNADRIVVGKNFLGRSGNYIQSVDLEKISFADIKTGTDFLQYYSGNNYKNISGSLTIKNCTFESMTDASYMFSGMYQNSSDSRGRNVTIENVSFPKLTNVKNMFTNFYLNNITFKNVYFPKLKAVNGMFNGGIGTLTFDGCHFPSLESISELTSGYAYSSGSSDSLSYGCISLLNMDFPHVTEVNQLVNLGMNTSTGKLLLENINFRSPVKITNLIGTSGAGINTIEFNNVTGDIVSLRDFLNNDHSSRPRIGVQKIVFKDFDTSHVTDMSYMFSCHSLTDLDLSSFDTSSVRDMSHMFYAPSLKTVNLSSFDTSNVCDMSRMFELVPAIESVDVSTFDTHKITADTAAEEMFVGVMGEQTIYIGDNWTLSEKDMPYICPSLNKQVGISKVTAEKYSHTSNVSDDGTQNGSYGNNWSNANIRGSDRTGSSSDAHVITISGAEKLNVSITYGSEANYDRVCMWKGSHPTFSASSNTGDSSLVANLSGLKSTKTYTVDGDTVTFSFSSDGSVISGGGYGYYAKIQKIEYKYKIINKYEYKQSIPTYPSSSSSAYIDTAMNDDTVRLRSDDSEICKVEKVNDNKWIYHFYVKDASGKYKAYEDDLHGYSTDHDSANPASLPDAVITNTPETLTGNLQINKQLRFYSPAVSSLISGEIDRDYKFTVTKLDDSKNEDKSFNGSFDAELYSRNDKANGNFTVSPYISYLQLRMEGNNYYNLSSREIGTGSSDITCSDQAVEFKNGKAEISVKAYQSMFIRYLPVGNYKIEEEDLPKYHTGHVVSPPVSHSDGNSVNISIKEGDYLFDSVQNAYVYKDLTLNKILKGRSKGTYKFRIDFSDMSNYYDSNVSFVKVDDDVDYNNNVFRADASSVSSGLTDDDSASGAYIIEVNASSGNKYAIGYSGTIYKLTASGGTVTAEEITDISAYSDIAKSDSGYVITDADGEKVTLEKELHAYNSAMEEYVFESSESQSGSSIGVLSITSVTAATSPARIIRGSHYEPDGFACYYEANISRTKKITSSSSSETINYYDSQGIITPDSNGNASVEIEINAEDVKNGQAVIHNIPAGARYRITELANDSIPSYQVKNENDVMDSGNNEETQKNLSTKEFTMAKGDSITADFTNVASGTGALKISKEADFRDISAYIGKWKMESYDRDDLTSAPLLNDLDGLTASSSAYVSEDEMKSTKALTSYTTYVYSDSKKEDCALKTTAAADSGEGKYSVYVNGEKVSSSYPYADIQKGWNKIQILTSGTDITVSAPVKALGQVTSAEKTDSVESSDLPDLEKDTSFNFTITLTNNAAATYIKGEKTFSGVKFTDGIAHISLKAGESKTIENLPAGTDYTVAEDISSQYIADDAEKSGTINENETAEEKFTNHYISGSSLSLSKKVVNGNDSQSNTSYKFSVKLSGLEKNRQYNIEKTSGDNLYEHRNLLLRSKAGTSIDNYQIVDHAPEIEYSEGYLSKLTKNISTDSTDSNSGYWMKFSKPLEKGKIYTLSFDYEAKISQNAISFSVDGGSVGNELSKKIEASTDGKAHYSFTFENTMSSDSENVNDRPYGLLISLNQAANGDWIKFSNMKLEEGDFGTDWTPAPEDMDAGFSSDADGNAEVTVYLKGDEKADFGNLPAAGTKYQITEEYADASCTTSNSAENSTASTDTGIQTINGTESTEFTNTFDNALISLPGTGNRTAMILRLLTMAGLFIAFIMFLKKKINEIEKKHGQNV